jgi:hypothetical protein
MLKFLIQKFKKGDENTEEGLPDVTEEMPEEAMASELPDDSMEEIIDDDYIKPENRAVREPKYKKPKRMSFSLAELSASESPKKEVSLEEAAKARARRRGK